MRILVVEDEPKFSQILQQGLTAERFSVDLATDGEQAVTLASEAAYDVIILDLRRPKIDGVAVLKRLRTQRLHTPVLLLTGRGETSERVRGLQAGADDFLLKPFTVQELLGRVRGLLGSPLRFQDKLQIADLELCRLSHRVTRAGRTVALTPKEYALLEYLMRNAGRPVTRGMIMEHVWGTDYQGLTNIVDVYINYVRSKVDKGSDKKLIHTARGVGYVLMDPEDQKAA